MLAVGSLEERRHAEASSQEVSETGTRALSGEGPPGLVVEDEEPPGLWNRAVISEILPLRICLSCWRMVLGACTCGGEAGSLRGSLLRSA